MSDAMAGSEREVVYRTLGSGERNDFLGLMVAAFHERELFDRYLEHDPQLGFEDTLVACEGERIVSSVQIFTRRIRLRGQALPLGGIGSVATHPDYEGRGLATSLLHRAQGEMRRRGMALSLLFTMRTSFYARLDWVRIDHPVSVVHKAVSERAAVRGRDFAASDLAGVKTLYEAYSGVHELTCLRDDAYWKAQLHFAGSPDECFRVIEREGRLLAYARSMEDSGIARAIEYACVEGAVDELAALLVGMTPHGRPLFVPDADPDLRAALGRCAGRVDALAFPDTMWRVLDRGRLEALAGVDSNASDTSDEGVLRALVDVPQAVFWPSDRF
jgi:predicted N-acetyltransferase YhbS